jgi:hypothetical protein
MAAFQAAPNVAQVEMRFTQQGQQVENVYHVDVPDLVTPAMFDTIAGVFALWFSATVVADVSTGLSLNSVIVRDLQVDGGIAIEHTTGLPVAGHDPQEQAPMNVTAAVKWVTGHAGRSFRGRTYHLGLTHEQYVNSTLTGAMVNVLHNDYTLLLTETIALGNPLCVLSRRHAKAVRAQAIHTPITGVIIDNTIDSQRRRLPGRGR